jgi:SAM-dependent methyltransferase
MHANSGEEMKQITQVLSKIRRVIDAITFRSSEVYWIERYKRGRNSGSGSYGQLAQFKADVINQFVEENAIGTVIEYGCGDGNQLTLAKYLSYIGFDVSPEAVALCKTLFKNDSTKTFYLMNEYKGQRADLTLSLDVIYHLVEDHVFEKYMQLLFDSSHKYVIIYSTNMDDHALTSPHVRHRNFTGWVERETSGWILTVRIPNAHAADASGERSNADFFIYEKGSDRPNPESTI